MWCYLTGEVGGKGRLTTSHAEEEGDVNKRLAGSEDLP